MFSIGLRTLLILLKEWGWGVWGGGLIYEKIKECGPCLAPDSIKPTAGGKKNIEGNLNPACLFDTGIIVSFLR